MKILLDLAFLLLFLHVCLHAYRLVFAGVCGLTVGLNRGVAPPMLTAPFQVPVGRDGWLMRRLQRGVYL